MSKANIYLFAASLHKAILRSQPEDAELAPATWMYTAFCSMQDILAQCKRFLASTEGPFL
jgi:hypothetical protein